MASKKKRSLRRRRRIALDAIFEARDTGQVSYLDSCILANEVEHLYERLSAPADADPDSADGVHRRRGMR